MLCDFDSAEMKDGRWVHVCQRCGTTRFATTEQYVRTCGRTPARGRGRRRRAGLGDWFALVFSLMGIKQCGGCWKRKRLLNRLGGLVPWL